MIVGGIEGEEVVEAFARAGLQRETALPRVEECHAGSNSMKMGSASVARIAAAQRLWRRAAEECRRRTMAIAHTQARKIVDLAKHAVRNASASSKFAIALIASPPFGSWK
jgi:hypothetical protein